MAGKTVVLGVGNTLLSDEGVGVHAIEYLRKNAPLLEDVDFIDGGTLSFTLAGALAEADHLIVIDAAELRAPPGTLTLFEGEDMDNYLGRGKRRSVHEVSLFDLLAITQLTDDTPHRRALIGIQPGSIDWGEAPSPEVAAVIPRACETVHRLVREWRQ